MERRPSVPVHDGLSVVTPRCRVLPCVASASDPPRRRVVVLGATGSIGVSTLDVIRTLENRLAVVGLSAHSSWQAMFEQAREFKPRWVAVTDGALADQVDPA